MPYIGNTPAEKYAAFNVQNFTTSATTSYTLDRAVANELDIRLVINNVIQQPGAGKAYTASGTTLTLSGATTGTDTMYAVYIGKAVQTVTPGANSVGPTALQDNSVTNAKLADATQGDIIYYGAAGAPAQLAAGTSGHVLQTQGAGANPVWAADAAGTITAFTNGVDNRLVTATSATALNGETNLIYNGTILGAGADGANADLGAGLHVKSADSGQGSVGAGADELVLENSGTCGLTILSGTSNPGNIYFGDSGNSSIGYINYNHNGDYMAFQTNASEKMRIDSVGNIDTTIAGNSTAGISFKTTTDHTANDKAYIGFHTSSGYGGNLVISRGGSDGFASETARFVNDGKFRIGTSNEIHSGGEKVAVNGGGSSLPILTLGVTHTSVFGGVKFRNGNGEIGSVTYNASSVAYNTSSDYRLKEAVNYNFDATTRLKELKPARFNFISDETNTLVDGFLAHEVSNVVPEAITGTKDAMHPEVLYADKVLYTAEDDLPEGMNIGDIKTSADELPEGKNFGDVKEATKINPQSIDQAKLVPLLTKALQEAITKIETLEAKVTALENA